MLFISIIYSSKTLPIAKCQREETGHININGKALDRSDVVLGLGSCSDNCWSCFSSTRILFPDYQVSLLTVKRKRSQEKQNIINLPPR